LYISRDQRIQDKEIVEEKRIQDDLIAEKQRNILEQQRYWDVTENEQWFIDSRSTNSSYSCSSKNIYYYFLSIFRTLNWMALTSAVRL
jgi:hypothetical protein